jgi:hypothetical protein
MLLLFQFIFLIFSMVVIGGIIQKKRAGHLGPKGAFFWILFWLFAVGAVLWPNSTTIIANKFGIGRGTDFVLYVSMALIFYLLFKMNVKIESVGRDITRVVRKKAIDEINGDNKLKY